MDTSGLETPVRKRPRSSTPSFSSSRHANKRFRSNSIVSPSPKLVRFDSLSHGEDLDAVMESDVPESPIAARKGSGSVARESACALLTPGAGDINNPFSKLTLKTPAHRKTMATPTAAKPGTDGTKSVRKSVRKTPGSVKSQKAPPFRIKVSWYFHHY